LCQLMQYLHRKCHVIAAEEIMHRVHLFH
jgi:hypothetical protein